MKTVRDWSELPDAARGGAVSIGNFDGVHQGHAALVSRLVAHARRLDAPAVVFTFDPHPAAILRPEFAPTPLTWPERKAELLGELGVDYVVLFPTNRTFLSLTADEFFDEVCLRRLQARAVVEGPNFFFGHKRGGDIGLLETLCARHGLEFEVVQPVGSADSAAPGASASVTGGSEGEGNGSCPTDSIGPRKTERESDIVSSSRIRELLGAGSVGEAMRLLGRPHRVRGMVGHGARRGTDLGYPTANVEVTEVLSPSQGIYAGIASIDGRNWPAAISIGTNPTFSEDEQKFEAFLLDFQGDLYGRCLEVDFLARLRDIVRFDSVQALTDQMAGDVEATRCHFEAWSQQGRPNSQTA